MNLSDMTEVQKRLLRVRIAKDVLEQLRLRFYKAERGTYVDFWTRSDDEGGKDFPELKSNCDLQSQLDRVGFCEVCGIGSLFVSLIRLKDQYKLNKCEARSAFIDTNRLRAALYGIFSEYQVLLIETAFEGRHIDAVYLNYDDYIPATNFAGSRTPAETLRRIMRNIIRNRGTFKP